MPRHRGGVFVARLICSDPDCAEAFEARAGTLAELDALACDCGCAVEVLGWPDETDDGCAALDLLLLA